MCMNQLNLQSQESLWHNLENTHDIMHAIQNEGADLTNDTTHH